MKLPIKKVYFDEIKKGGKIVEYRDAHITFICEETGETIVQKVINTKVFKRPKSLYPKVLKDDYTIAFYLDNWEVKK